jgi:hypothetical protein
MQPISAVPQGSGCALVLVAADSKQAYLAVFLSNDRGNAPLYIVGPMSKAACLSHSDSISAQLSTNRKREHIVSKNCASTARESIPPEGCSLSSSMSAVPDLPSAHLWRYDCAARASTARKSAQRSAASIAAARVAAAQDVSPEPVAAADEAPSQPSEDMAVLPAPTPVAPASPTPVAPASPPAPASAGALTTANSASAQPQSPSADTQKTAPVVSAAAANASADTIPGDLLMVKTADPGAADRIASYCNTATAAAADRVSVAAGCRHQEVDAWTRLVLHNEFPSLDDATRRKCNQPPFPDSYVAKESCAKYELRLN